jgi:DNA processing protein
MEAQYYNILNIGYDGDYFRLRKLKEKFGSWTAGFEAVKNEIKFNLQKEWINLEKTGVRLILNSEKEFPRLLREMPWPPFGIYIAGNLPDDLPRISIVGTRKCTPQGRTTAYRFAKELAEAGATIVSGLAFGIDTAAHQGTLAGRGKTIAVLAGGLDYVYPRQNEKLARQILEAGGALVSEYAKGPPAYSSRFVERNRIVSGLALGTVIVEASKESGALHTARFAVEQNRSVFALPGPVNHHNYAGSHALIRAGAVLVTEVGQILEDLNLIGETKKLNPRQTQLEFLNEKQKAILNVLEKESGLATIDKIQELTKMEISELNQSLTLLLLQDIIKESGGRYYIN